MKDELVDVLVVGAGPVGLVLASELVRHGVSVRVIEKVAERPRVSKGLTIHSRSLETFDLMGLADRLVEAGFRSRGLNLSSDTGSHAFVSMGDLPGRFPYILILPQWRTEEIVEGHLAGQGVAVERQRELLELRPRSGQVDAVVELPDGDREAIRARWVVGCDGAHSAVRKGSGIEFAGQPYPWAAQVMDIQLDTDEPIDVLENYTTKRGFVMFMPFADGTHRVITMDHAQHDAHVPTVAENQALIDTVVSAKRIQLVGDPVWSSHLGVLQHRQATTYRKGRVLLAGDAAHINFPTGGQGMNAGINDSVNLAWKLALTLRGQASAGLLDSYEEERHPVAKAVGKLTHRMSKLYTVRHPLGLLVRKRFLKVVGHKRSLQQKMAMGLSGHAVSYDETARGRTLSNGALGAKAVQAGAPAPEVHLLAPDGAPVRLYELLREPFFHLFLLVPPGASETALASVQKVLTEVRTRHPGVVTPHVVFTDVAEGPADLGEPALADPTGEFASRYGASAPAAILVRPDGFVGAHLSGLDAGAIDTALAAWVVTR